MKTVQDQLKDSIEALMKLEPSEIEVELGRRLEETKKELENGQILSVAAPMIVPPDATQLAAAPVWLKDLGQAFVRKLTHQMYSLVCDEKDPDNVKVRQALGGGAQQVALVISGVLVATFGLLPGIATAVAVIVGKRIAKAGQEALCDTWKSSIKS
jgi:hypothetical protein